MGSGGQEGEGDRLTSLSARLVGRDREFARLLGLARLASAGGSGATAVLGPSGIGKTALLQAVAELSGPSVISVEGVEEGGAPPYSGLTELCAPLQHLASQLAWEHRQALETALRWGADGGSVDPYVVGAALVDLLGRAGSRGGLLVMVDDSDFLDRASFDALVFTARRLGQEGVAMFFTARDEAGARDPLASLDTLRLEGLNPTAARTLLAASSGGRIGEAVAAELLRAAEGNPLALIELPVLLSPDQLAGRVPLPAPLPVGERLCGIYGARSRVASDRVRQALLVAAASFGNLDAVAGGLDRLGLSLSDLQAAAETGLLSLDAGKVEFRHPLARSAVYYLATEADRQVVHRALADANASLGELERQAWHVARGRSVPDTAAAAIVSSAAVVSYERGGLVQAAQGFESAAQLSPDPETRTAYLVQAAEAWLMAGRIDTATDLAEEVLAGEAPVGIRDRAALVRGRALLLGGSEDEGRRYLTEQAERVGDRDPDLAIMMTAAAAASALRAGELEQVRAATSRSGWVDRAGKRARELAGLVSTSVRVAGGDPAVDRTRLVEWVLADLNRSDSILLEVPVASIVAPLALIRAEDLDGARSILDRMEARVRSSSSPTVLPAVLTTRALLEHRCNRWPVAEAAASEALDLALQTGQEAMVPYATTLLATAEAVLGRAQSCRERCLVLLGAPSSRIPIIRSGLLSALGLLELGEGRPREAVRWYEVLAATASGSTASNPGLIMWGADLAEAYFEAGQLVQARAVADQLADQAKATGSPRALAAARRVQALLCEDDAEAETNFAAALRYYGGPLWSFARARLELARGQRLARAGRRSDAERRLSHALTLFQGLEASGWAARAGHGLAQLGVRTPGPAEPAVPLTPLERQVAMAVAMGGEVERIASGLYLGEKTVVAALESASLKLGVSDPRRLADRLGQLIAGEWGASGAERTGPVPTRPRLRLLGDCEIALASGTVPCPPGLGGQVIKHLALAGRLPVEELVEELWPDAPPGAGRNRLRTLLTRLRASTGDLVVRDGGWVSLDPEVEVDARVFEEAARTAQAAASGGDPGAAELAGRAIGLYRGELLPLDRHLSFTVGPRERLRRLHLATVYLAVGDAVSQSQAQAALGLLEGALTDNPHEEELYLRAAEILLSGGRITEARAMLRRATRALAELGVTLSPRGRRLEEATSGR